MPGMMPGMGAGLRMGLGPYQAAMQGQDLTQDPFLSYPHPFPYPNPNDNQPRNRSFLDFFSRRRLGRGMADGERLHWATRQYDTNGAYDPAAHDRLLATANLDVNDPNMLHHHHHHHYHGNHPYRSRHARMANNNVGQQD